ncbi:MAG: hypothetical protein NC817_02230 [Candidatus Omnitrophica bacterium]|nr:hypothetical protein [Candidatus Omnitrophota bacterium]MCM8823932.1 hypothetical protein [Candidatus Omnitrophota bacterium]MCM8827142.1 hypothetical protein [Candidatus Omnitrophota bacterium]
MKLKDIGNSFFVWGAISEDGLNYIKDKNKIVIVPENRPYLIGLNWNVPLLESKRIKFVYCTDNMLGILLFKRKVDELVIFYREIKDNGMVGICGSLYVSILSKLHNVNMTTFPQGRIDLSYFDQNASTLGGRKFINQENDNSVVIAEDEFIPWEILR